MSSNTIILTKPYYSISDGAKICGLTYLYFWRLCRDKKLTELVGGRLKITAKKLADMLKIYQSDYDTVINFSDAPKIY